MEKEFKVWYENAPATQEQLDAIEEIVVEQEINLAWSAQIKIPVCIREDGSWDGENDPIYAEGKRVRVEAQINGNGWVPLIDGTIQQKNRDLNADPGMSSITLIVKDDTDRLHRAHTSASYPAGSSDSEIAAQIFSESGFTPTTDIEDTDPPTDQTSVVHQHGTPMEMLRTLVSRNRGYSAYLLPGDTPGMSVGCFRTLPVNTDGLPVMYLTGPDRNLASFNVSQLTSRATRFRGDTLNTREMSESNGDASYDENVAPGGEGATTLGSGDIRERRLPPGLGDQGDPQASAASAALESSYTLRVEGSVLPKCYGAILTPYLMVSARLSNSRFSTDYVIFRVTHTLGRSEYTQSFSLRGNMASPEAAAGASLPAGAAVAAGAAAVSFNIQVDIF